jgi:hypothetical protein
MAEDGDAGAGPEEVERLADRDVECAPPARNANEKRIDDARQLMAGRFVTLPRERPAEDGRGIRKRGEVRFEGVAQRRNSFGHRFDRSAPLRHSRRVGLSQQRAAPLAIFTW